MIELGWAATVGASLITGTVGGTVAGGMVERRRIMWLAKRDACMTALEIVNRHFAHVAWETDGSRRTPLPQDRPSMADIRHCHNLLATTCNRPGVVEAYLACFGINGAGFDASAISVLRTAIRKELGRRGKLAEDLDRSYISAISTSLEAQEAAGDERPEGS